MSDDNVIQFPSQKNLVRVESATNFGVYSLNIAKIKDISVYKNCIHIWFSRNDTMDAWDLTLDYETHEDAQGSYEELSAILQHSRRSKFKKITSQGVTPIKGG